MKKMEHRVSFYYFRLHVCFFFFSFFIDLGALGAVENNTRYAQGQLSFVVFGIEPCFFLLFVTTPGWVEKAQVVDLGRLSFFSLSLSFFYRLFLFFSGAILLNQRPVLPFGAIMCCIIESAAELDSNTRVERNDAAGIEKDRRYFFGFVSGRTELKRSRISEEKSGTAACLLEQYALWKSAATAEESTAARAQQSKHSLSEVERKTQFIPRLR